MIRQPFRIGTRLFPGLCVLLGSLAVSTPAAAPRLPAGVKVYRDVRYVTDGDPAQALDLYLPETPSERPLPVILWVHGGAWHHGSKASVTGVDLVPEGYALASIEYRFVGVALFPAQIQDCQAAVRWLRAHARDYNLDPDHIGAWGGSAGGHLVSLLGTTGGKHVYPPIGGNEDQPDTVQAVCDWYGPSDLNLAYWPGLFGDQPKTKTNCDYASPSHFVSRDSPPFLIMHGTADTKVSIRQSELLAAALEQAGVDVVFQRIYGSGHGIGIGYPAVRGLIKAFFDNHLKGMEVKLDLLPDADATVKPRAKARPLGEE